MSCAGGKHRYGPHPTVPVLYCSRCASVRRLDPDFGPPQFVDKTLPELPVEPVDEFEPVAPDAQADANILNLIRTANEPVNEETIEAAKVILSMNGRAENIEVDGDEYVPRRVRAQPNDDSLPDAGL